MKIIKSKLNNYEYSKEFFTIYNSSTGNYLTNNVVSKNCGMMDEMDFYSKSSMKKDIFSLYNKIRSRIESRFIARGLIRDSRLILLSSKRSSSDFLENYITQVKKDPLRAGQLYLVDRPIWDIKTKDYPPNSPKFLVAVGNKSLSSQIIEPDQEVIYKDQGYRILQVPESLRLSFESDINLALQDKAGIALDDNIKFLPTTKIERAFRNTSNLVNPFSVEVIMTSIDDEKSILDYLDINKLKDNVGNNNLYIHGDLAFSSDKLGIAGSILMLKEYSSKVGGRVVKTTKVYAQPVFYVGLKSTKGQEINLNKFPEFIKELDEYGFNIKRVSADSFQSKSILQLLRKYDSITLSVDRPTDAYDYFKLLLQDEIISLYPHDLLLSEMNDVVRDTVSNKIDHSKEGSKDILDAIVGSSFSAITSEESKSLSSSYSMEYSYLDSVTKSIDIEYNEDLIKSSNMSDSNTEDYGYVSNYDNIFENIEQEKGDEF